MIYCIDTETTGHEDGAEVIELAWVGLELGAWRAIGEPEVKRFSPSRPILLGALATHHILPEELVGLTPASRAMLPAQSEYIVGHNIDYDWKVLGKPPAKRICTLALARHLFPACDSHSLSALVYHFNEHQTARELLRNAHSAGADVLLCVRVLNQMLAAAGRSFPTAEALWQFSELARIPRTMAFGKYKGKLVGDVPRDYALWYQRQTDTDPYMIEAFRRAGKL